VILFLTKLTAAMNGAKEVDAVC